MSNHERALAAIRNAPAHDKLAILRAASQALDAGLADEVAARLSTLVDDRTADPRLWQFLGLALRDLQDSGAAHSAFNRAAALAPADALIAHSQARTALEAGFPSVDLFSRASQLAPSDASIILGRSAALLAEGRGEEGMAYLDSILAANPGWLEGHVAYGRLTAVVASGTSIDATVRRSLMTHPEAGALWQTRIQLLMEARRLGDVIEVVAEARDALGSSLELDRIEAICRSETGDPISAQTVFDNLPLSSDGETTTWPIRNLIRLGRHDEAAALADRTFATNDASIWPYRSLLWRLTGDPRWAWLEGDPRMIQTFDIASEVGSLEHLAEMLRALHLARGEPLDQSVRGGSQTDGNLLARAEPELRRLRYALLEAVRSYVSALPPPDSAHPMLLARRQPISIAGSWSVRLLDRGYHADHIHCQGWVSSAFYVVVPAEDESLPQGGWLAFGECRDLLPDLPAFHMVRPAAGTLALFPSIMWHGTRPFGSGERMTVAFDIARPQQP